MDLARYDGEESNAQLAATLARHHERMTSGIATGCASSQPTNGQSLSEATSYSLNEWR